jgi:N,N'-diacetyllegionaminate synthase
MNTLKVGRHQVGKGCAPYVIAEIGSNHNGDMALCRCLIDAATEAGAHAVKFQSWSEHSLISRQEYEANTQYSDKKKHFGSLLEMVRAYQLTPTQHREVNSYCRERGIAFASSCFSAAEVDLLDKLDVPFLKIASMDIVYPRLLKHAARTGRPIVLSTGMATLGEIETAVETIHSEGNDKIILLHCVSIYPPDFETIHLRNIITLEQAFELPVGFSDHTIGTSVPLAAIALGACVIEKHFTIDKDMEGWDHAISANPAELSTIVTEGQRVVVALGSSRRVVTAAEVEKRKKFRRSVVATRALEKGYVIVDADLDAKRPGNGIAADQIHLVVGRKLAKAVADDQLIHWSDLE